MGSLANKHVKNAANTTPGPLSITLGFSGRNGAVPRYGHSGRVPLCLAQQVVGICLLAHLRNVDAHLSNTSHVVV